MEKQPFVERMLETENLTDELADPDAKWLLDWGIGKLDPLLKDAADPEQAGAKVNQLMAVMRKVNRIAGVYTKKSPADLAVDLKALQDLCAAAFSHASPFGLAGKPQTPEQLAAGLSQLSQRQVIELLCQACG